MIEDAAGVAPGTRVHCDVCIVGAGAAGITLASALDGAGLGVLVLESGGRSLEPETQALHRGELRGAPQFPLDRSRLRLLGGTTNHWQGMCRPLDPEDFALRPWVPDSGWPIARADLDPYYARAHEVCDLGPFDYRPAAWEGFGEAGPRLEAEPDFVPKLVQHSPPTKFARKYDGLLARASGPRVLLHANAHEIVSGAGPRGERRVERVVVRTLGGGGLEVRPRALVLAAGAIENARILLASAESDPALLGSGADRVGRFFMDHPGAVPFGVLVYRDASYRWLAERRRVHDVMLVAGLGLTAAAQRRERVLANAAYFLTPASLEEVRDFEWSNIVQVVSGTLGESDLEMVRFLETLSTSEPGALASIAWIRSEQAPSPDSRVRLGDALDALGQRRVVVDWRLGELEQRTFERTADLLARALTRSGVGRVKLLPWLQGGGDEWWRRVTPGWHHLGTTRMASEPARGVVDRDCRVFGVDNLYLAGSSVFPTSSYVNPTLTLVALALRLAEHLRGALGTGGGMRDEVAG